MCEQNFVSKNQEYVYGEHFGSRFKSQAPWKTNMLIYICLKYISSFKWQADFTAEGFLIGFPE